MSGEVENEDDQQDNNVEDIETANNVDNEETSQELEDSSDEDKA